MKRLGSWIAGLAVSFGSPLLGESVMDRVGEALTWSLWGDRARVRMSGRLEVEEYRYDDPAPGLIYATGGALTNPRATLFLDAQVGAHAYGFVQARVDCGFDPAEAGVEARLDEYAVRLRPWLERTFTLQVGKFATVVGNWVERHGTWENPFITAPLIYEQTTAVEDHFPVTSSEGLLVDEDRDEEKYEYVPVIWGPSYATGVSGAGRFGDLEWALELKNAGLSSRPRAWDPWVVGYEHPSMGGRLVYSTTPTWRFGVSASESAYYLPEASAALPVGTGLGDYKEILLGQDVQFAWRHWQVWAEVFEARFELPTVGNGDLVGYYIETKYAFAPGFFVAGRWNQQVYGEVFDSRGGMTPWGQDIWRSDVAFGYRPTAHTQAKVQWSVQRRAEIENMENLLALQFTLRF